ncbi:MAG: hypothetical protein ACOCX7_03615 [Bacteroidota bacterium]
MRKIPRSIDAMLGALARRGTIILIIMLLGGFALRIGAIFAVGDIEDPEMWEHGKIARNLLEHDRFTMHWPYPSLSEERLAEQSQPPPYDGAFITPLNPYIIYIFFEAFGDNPTAYLWLMVFNAFLGALAILPAYYIALLLAGRRSAVIAAILMALFMPAIYGVVTFSGSQLYHLLALCVIFFAISYIIRRRMWDILLLGLFCGLLTLARSEFLILSVVLIAASVVGSCLRFNCDMRIIRMVAALAIFAAVVGPWVYRNTQLFGKIVPVVSHPWHEIWRGSNPYATGGTTSRLGTKVWESREYSPELLPKLDSIPYNQHFEIAADSVFKEAAIDYIESHPAEALWKAVKRAVFLWTVDVYTPRARHPVYVFFVLITVVPAAFAFWKLYRRERIYQNPAMIYLLFAAYYTALIFAVNLETRYQVYMLTVIVPMAAVGWERLLMKKSK